MTPEQKALQALRMLYEVADLGDFVYDIRERECQGWEGPNVAKWGKACALAQEALKEAP